MKKYILILALLMTACGGGNFSQTLDSLKVSTYPLKQAFLTRMTNGATDNYSGYVNANCSGTDVTTIKQPVAATFEGIPALAVAESDVITLPTCTPNIIGFTTTTYTDSNYVPIGYSMPGSVYGVVAIQTPLPVSAHVGDSGTYVTLNTFTDITKSVSVGHMTISYSVTQDTSVTAIVTIIATLFDNNGATPVVTTNKYKIDTSGILTPISIDIVTTTVTGITHSLFTKV